MMEEKKKQKKREDDIDIDGEKRLSNSARDGRQYIIKYSRQLEPCQTSSCCHATKIPTLLFLQSPPVWCMILREPQRLIRWLVCGRPAHCCYLPDNKKMCREFCCKLCVSVGCTVLRNKNKKKQRENRQIGVDLWQYESINGRNYLERKKTRLLKKNPDFHFLRDVSANVDVEKWPISFCRLSFWQLPNHCPNPLESETLIATERKWSYMYELINHRMHPLDTRIFSVDPIRNGWIISLDPKRGKLPSLLCAQQHSKKKMKWNKIKEKEKPNHEIGFMIYDLLRYLNNINIKR